MIISHKHKFIFIKTRKTAGTSIEEYLSKFCGPDDIITPRREDKSCGQNHRGFFNFIPELVDDPANFKPTLDDFIHRKKYYHHIESKKIKNRLGSQVWNSYYKFCFERNPWDRCVSGYWYIKGTRTNPPKDFESWILNRSVERLSNFNIYAIEGKVQANYIGRFENLLEDMSHICSTIGLPFDGQLPRVKSNYRQDKLHYSQYYSDKTKAYVENLCRREIELCKYAFASI